MKNFSKFSRKLTRQVGASDERGFVLVIALIVLLVATVVGIFAIQNTSIDTKISGNERVATLLFNTADSGANAGVAWFKDHTTPYYTAPSIANTGSNAVYSSSYSPLGSGASYKTEVMLLRREAVGGYEMGTKSNKNVVYRYYYLVRGTGKTDASAGSKEVEMEVSCIFK